LYKINNPITIQQQRQKHYVAHKDYYKQKASLRKRHLGFNKLVESDWNEPIDWHHVNDNDVVPLPTYLHKMCYTGETIRHREICNRLVSILYPELKIEGD